MNIAVFGGAFDPPHLGHIQIIQSLLESSFDEVWCVPVKNHAFGKQMLPAHHRVAMLELALSGMNNIKIDEYELHQPGVNYTYDTLVAFKQHYPEHTFSFVIGSDNLPTFYTWFDDTPGILEFPFFVYPRKGFSFEPLFEGMTPMRNMQEVAISSTQVRQAVMAGESIEHLVPPAVEKYIQQQKLYQP
ncbi:MAG: nicotinate (nicotinamide) nucleotide adenylyltransferase [Pseudomonadales bacterium]|nr:nicotinate (nicotinamide) nucleotide adenylyltransferase [Candidatus Woesebacteria bacterium]MCB9801959.1 nicotinate (nicotinamide) nucleotide adenylyltransferase [Pseudomonadales bacterium]